MDNKAKVGTSTTLLSFLFGKILTFENGADEIIFWLQVTAFLVSILVGILTACYYVKKLLPRKFNNNEKVH
jgi:hypothetical protein